MNLEQFPGFEYYGDQLADAAEMAQYTMFDSYQDFTDSTAIYPKDKELEYLMMGLVSEVGEMAGKVKKEIRDGKIFEQEDFTKELGDVLWYVARLAAYNDACLSWVAEANVKKLSSRMERGVIGGSGDDR